VSTTTAADRLAYTIPEAWELLGVGRTYFRSQILPDLRVVRRGRRVLVPRAELERWLDQNSARLLDG
jgi:excisionase family DNA binding protein